MEITMTQEKSTKNSVRFGDGVQPHGKNIYLTKEEVTELGNPDAIKVTIEAA